MWFGYTLWSKVAVVFLTAFFPVVVGTYDGLHKRGEIYRELLLTLGATRWDILRKTQIPLALPSFFSGLKLSIVYCVIGATIGEWLGGSRGLGYFSRRMAGNLQSAEMFAAVFLLSALGVVLFLGVAGLEKYILKKRGIHR
ncbi:putative aliphatic sulfonates transport permease protein SsuC [compost metagenome]